MRDGGRVVAKAFDRAWRHETGRREILGLDVGEAETEAFWTEFLRGLVARGLVGVQLAISDAHAGDQHGLLAALIRPIFNADTPVHARGRLSEVVAHLEGRLGKVATMLEDAEPEILAFLGVGALQRPRPERLDVLIPGTADAAHLLLLILSPRLSTSWSTRRVETPPT